VDARVIGIIAVVGLVQLTLQVVALVQLVKTPGERVSLGGRKWAWALIIALGEIIGAVLWFVLGKTPVAAERDAGAVDTAVRRDAVDGLYGPAKE
jgi:hypothetical protein